MSHAIKELEAALFAYLFIYLYFQSYYTSIKLFSGLTD